MNIGHENPEVSVLVVDDSAFMRTALSRMIASDPGLRVVGTASSGNEALHRIADLNPDVITLDVEMPGLGGLETLKRIMAECPRPVIMVSADREGCRNNFQCARGGGFRLRSEATFGCLAGHSSYSRRFDRENQGCGTIARCGPLSNCLPKTSARCRIAFS